MSDNRNDMWKLAEQTKASQDAITEIVGFVARGRRAQAAVDKAIADAQKPATEKPK